MDYLGGVAWLLLLVVLAGGLALFRFGVAQVTVYEYEKGLKYANGKFVGVLEPGRYRYWRSSTLVQRIDVRPRFVTVGGQEILSSDGVTLKISIAANFEIADADVAINKNRSYQDALYLELQIAARDIIGAADIDSVLKDRSALSARLFELTEPKATALGLRLVSVDIKDIMFPGKLKEIFAQVVNARHEGLAALEKARGETAALRNLANAAAMVQENPALMQLRLLQTIGQSSGNTLVLDVGQTAPLPPASGGAQDAAVSAES